MLDFFICILNIISARSVKYSICAGKEDNFLIPHATDLQFYYQCLKQEGILKQCPTKLSVFDPILLKCVSFRKEQENLKFIDDENHKVRSPFKI